MSIRDRRTFLKEISNGMLITGLGATLAGDIGIGTSLAKEGESNILSFGSLRPLAGLMQETPPDKLMPILVKKLQAGETNHKDLVAAAALANAETFGGQDYVGFHTEMALLPAYQMSAELPSERKALPILKVLYRNSARIQECGGGKRKRLRPVTPNKAAGVKNEAETLRAIARQGKMDEAESLFATMTTDDLKQAYNEMLWTVQDGMNVHRFVLAHRSYALIDIVGKEHAHTMLRQCVRFCVDSDQGRIKRKLPEHPIRKYIPKLLDQYRLLEKKIGSRDPGDEEVNKLAETIYRSNKERATDTVAAAIADGIAPEVICEAISLAANQLALCQDHAGKSGWRTHGDSPGVHGSDAANAWRNMIRVSDHRNTVVGLMVSAYHTAQYRPYKQEPYPHRKHREDVKATDARGLLAAAEEAIRSNDQGVAAATIQIYGEKGFAVRPVLDLMLRYAISEDGRLHSEKFYRTVTEEYGTIRKAYRWRQIVALARVTASAYGYSRHDKKGMRAPGYEESCRLLKVKA